MTAKYAVGMDLGTTNCVIAYCPLTEESADVRVLTVPQLVAPGTVESQDVLPSFMYLPAEHELTDGAFDLPATTGRNFAVGQYALKQAAEVPQRTVCAAKSWLVNHRVDRQGPILPWNAPEDVPKLSPVVASQRYLEHLADTWNAAFPDCPLDEQDVIVTVPASFDPHARELTRQAAIAAGLADSFVLLEEPQAAVYAWLDRMGDSWRRRLSVGDCLLVCDIGGGTTDLTVVAASDQHGELTLDRLAVGRHLLVGGDNMDVALAHHAAGLFGKQGTKLDPWQSVSLWHACRAAKEQLLADDGPETHSISVLGRGSKLIGGTVSVELQRKKASALLVDGFFPKCPVDARPEMHRSSGFQEIGLLYESDTAITRHLASFLADQGETEPLRPSHVLFNGGVFKSALLRKRLLDVLRGWNKGKGMLTELREHHDLEHAVARGAAYYAWSKKHGGVRIRGGTARSYYVGIETSGLAVPGAARPLRALCVVPKGMEEGTEADVPSAEFGLVVGEPTRFRFFGSTTRKDDVGDLLNSWTEYELQETASLETELSRDDQIDEPYVPVRFHSRITELGVFELWCVSSKSDRRWKLEFSVREDPDAS